MAIFLFNSLPSFVSTYPHNRDRENGQKNTLQIKHHIDIRTSADILSTDGLDVQIKDGTQQTVKNMKDATLKTEKLLMR